MDLSAIPYMVISRELDFGFSNERIYVALCLIDHNIVGVGLSRDEAMRAMIAEIEDEYGDEGDDYDPEIHVYRSEP